MNPSSYEQNKRRVFDSFCKKVLKHDVRNYYNEIKRRQNREELFSELSEQEMAQLSIMDNYFATEQTFKVIGSDVIVNDGNIADALRTLPERNRDIILLSYFLELSDGEIGKKLNLIRSTVQYQRTRTLQELKKLLEEETADGRSETEK